MKAHEGADALAKGSRSFFASPSVSTILKQMQERKHRLGADVCTNLSSLNDWCWTRHARSQHFAMVARGLAPCNH